MRISAIGLVRQLLPLTRKYVLHHYPAEAIGLGLFIENVLINWRRWWRWRRLRLCANEPEDAGCIARCHRALDQVGQGGLRPDFRWSSASTQVNNRAIARHFYSSNP